MAATAGPTSAATADTPLPLRLRNFRSEADGYLASLGGPRHYMVRLREIEAMTADHELALEGERRRVARAVRPDEFPRAWRDVAEHWRFDEVNVFVSASETHNRKNTNKSIEDSLHTFGEVVAPALAAGR